VYTFIIIINLYIGLHTCFFLHALAWKLGHKLPYWACWAFFVLASLVYLFFNFRGIARSGFGILNGYWGAMLATPLFLLLDIVSLTRFVFFKSRPLFYAEPRFTLLAHIAFAVLLTGIIAYGSWTARHVVVTRYSVTTQKPLPENGLTITLVSDIHAGAMVKKKQLDQLVSAVNALEGDIILLAGDIIDRANQDCIDEYTAGDLSRLSAPLGVYAVTGNHEYIGGDLDEFYRRNEADGIRLLMYEAELTGADFYVIGRIDRRAGGRKTLAEITGGLDQGLPLIMMDHQPFNLEEAEAAGMDLQLSGHTHKGQIWPGPIVTRRMYENDYGLLYKGRTAIVVTSGFGTWGPPLRIGTLAEIVSIRLTNEPVQNQEQP
jgi:predicted MPP superfamily phosphohydrolase